MKYLLFLLCALLSLESFGQNPSDNLYNECKAWIDIKDTKGVQGSEFLYGDWNRGVLVLNDSLFFMQNALAYNAFNSKIFIKKEDTKETVFEVNDASLTSFSIIENNTRIKHDFVRLLKKDFKEGNSMGYFEIINNRFNTNYLIKNPKIVIYDPNKSKGTAAINNYPLEFKEEVTYYIKDEANLYVEVNLRKKDIMPFLKLYPSKINSYIKSKKISFNDEQEVGQLVNYYYSLKN